jgi:hypothetical protein
MQPPKTRNHGKYLSSEWNQEEAAMNKATANHKRVE